MPEECINCRFYRKDTYPNRTKVWHKEWYLGFCRIHAPSTKEFGFPETRDEGWCGDYAEGVPQFFKEIEDGDDEGYFELISAEEAERLQSLTLPPASPDQSISA